MSWEFDWDEAKAAQNLEERGLHFREAARFDWATAENDLDRRRDYGEPRYIARGFLDGRLHILVYVLRNDRLRVISLRRANLRERKKYAAAKKDF